MEIRQLEYFREIATTGSINEAARSNPGCQEKPPEAKDEKHG